MSQISIAASNLKGVPAGEERTGVIPEINTIKYYTVKRKDNVLNDNDRKQISFTYEGKILL